LGSPQELAEAFLAYKEIGVSEFIISGWPEFAEVEIFGQQVLPLIRQAERQTQFESHQVAAKGSSSSR
jgi:alkanesulfonate monooxygenase